MQKTLWLPIVAIVIGALGLMMIHSQTMVPGDPYPGDRIQQQGRWGYCPYCGEYIKPGLRYEMGPGMMGRGFGPGPWMMRPDFGYGPGYQQTRKPMDEKAAKEYLEHFLQSTGNPNLKLGNIEDKGRVFEVQVVTKDDSLVDKLVVDKRTGWLRSIY